MSDATPSIKVLLFAKKGIVMKSKYGHRPDPMAPMIERALDWVNTSLVYDIPVMTEYSAFSRALLSAATRDGENEPSINVTQAMIARSMEFLHKSDIMEVSAVITYPEFMRDLLMAVFSESISETPTVTIVPSPEAPLPA